MSRSALRFIALCVVSAIAFSAMARDGGAHADPSVSDEGAVSSVGLRPSDRVSLSGVSLPVLSDWTAETFTNRFRWSVFRLGNFAFPRSDADDVGQIARDAMRSGDILINLVDVTPTDAADRDGPHEGGLMTVRASDVGGRRATPCPRPSAA
jgi:hypothetical protein